MQLNVILKLLLCFLLFSSCQRTFTITRDSIYYSGWAQGEYQGFKIAKIKFLDSTISVFNENFNPYQLTNYTFDSSFCFVVVSSTDTRKLKEKINF